ncbi:MAG: DNA replication complex GINS family protein [Candidatus Aenigmatarchaeota archaeon]|nr:MAG: DNA replication complex GINS family protein [Candidatus Aenigmarchaeota archaeon]
MNENVITYETFRRFQRLEKENDALQKLPEDFYDLCRDWIKRKELLFEKTKEPSLVREIENVMQVIRDVMDRREHKLVKLAINYIRGGTAPQNLLPAEKTCFDVVVSELERVRKASLERIRGAHTQAAPPQSAAPVQEPPIEKTFSSTAAETKKEVRPEPPVQTANPYLRVRMLSELERFLGTDGKVYGPVAPGDVVDVPSEIANLLLEKKLAAVG